MRKLRRYTATYRFLKSAATMTATANFHPCANICIYKQSYAPCYMHTNLWGSAETHQSWGQGIERYRGDPLGYQISSLSNSSGLTAKPKPLKFNNFIIFNFLQFHSNGPIHSIGIKPLKCGDYLEFRWIICDVHLRSKFRCRALELHKPLLKPKYIQAQFSKSNPAQNWKGLYFQINGSLFSSKAKNSGQPTPSTIIHMAHQLHQIDGHYQGQISGAKTIKLQPSVAFAIFSTCQPSHPQQISSPPQIS